MKTRRGFTLIELLVVIAIIGILSSVVLASLNTARGKGSDAAAKQDIFNVRAQAELVYDNTTPGSYATVCSDLNVIKGVNAAATAEGFTWGTPTTIGTNTTDVACTNAAGTWVAYIHLVKGAGASWYCVDSTGQSKTSATSPGTSATAC